MDVTVDKVESFGLFVRWPGGRGLRLDIEIDFETIYAGAGITALGPSA